ncbi:adenomatous polyposis coli protein, partial [Biomphalaria glabrata]
CSDMDHHPGSAIAALMKLSFDEDYRHAICTLGGLQAIAELLEIENRVAGPAHDYDTTVRRYACMTLTNLTFGDGKNKALLCSMKGAMEALVDQLRSPNEDLIQAAASVLRNLSWRADLASKKTLREIGAVTTLMKSAMIVKKETTLKSILSALWNLSSHCSENKAEICAVDGALQFLVGLLTYKSAAKTLAIVENGGGILRNVSSQIAIREDYRLILRQSGCLQILLHHLRSTSLTIVSNACGTLWNLSARCEEDQNTLREMGAVSMLKNLVHSRHKMISSESSAALRNLVSSIPSGNPVENEKTVKATRPSLHALKQQAMEAELDQSLSKTCENVDNSRDSPTNEVHRSENEPRRFVYNHNQASGAFKNSADTANRMLLPQLVACAGSQESTSTPGKRFNNSSTQFRTMPAAHQNKTHHLPMQLLSVYAETDLDCVVDQPTDFSLLYNEVSEESCSDSFQEQPINYSIRYRDNATAEGPDIPVYQDERHCVECKYAEAMRADYRMDNSSNDDQVRTFCTESTPYLSTGISLTDLTQAGKADGERDEEDEDMNMSGQDNYDDGAASKNATLIDPDRTLTESDQTMTKLKCEADHVAGSSGSQTTDRRTGSTVVCGSSGGNCAPMLSKASSQMSDIQTDQPNFHADTYEGALDQTKTYCEEGTPVCFSRVSSLSSLHSSEARDGDGPFRLVGNMTEKIELANIEEIETPEARVTENEQAAAASGKPGSKLRRTSTDQVARIDREAKTVTFDENHQVEQTPLMFSRSSSPESLSSFDTQSVHSSVISEYSRRASEVVSPSDIPDSPSESMPSSPRRTHSPTHRFKDVGLGPKPLAAAKQILDVRKPVNLFKPEPYLNFTSFEEDDKPINFAIRNAEKDLPLLNTFADFEEDQPVNFSAYSQETPPITFSTFQKNIAPPSVFPNIVTNRAKTLPTLVEHANESEVAVSGKLEIPASYLGLNPAPKMSEIPAKEQSIAAKTEASTQSQEPNLTKVQETESGTEIVTKMASAPTTATVAVNKPWSPATEQLKQEDGDSSMSEREEDILAQCISSGMPTPSASSSARKIRRATVKNTVRKKSAIPTKASAIPKLSTPSAEHSKAITLTQQSSTPTSTKLLRSGINLKNAKIPLKSEPAKTLIQTFKLSTDAAAVASGSSTANFMVPSTAHTAATVKSSVSKNLTPALNRAAELRSPKKGLAVTKNVCDSLLPHTQNLNQYVDINEDCIRSYATEGTPLNFSAATSLSDLSVAGDKVDRPIKFVVEDTPVCFSRNSSLSSITSLDKPEQPYVPAPNQNSSTGIKIKLEMKQNEFNDSLNDELADCDPTPSEQALLEQCINSVMPKSRHSRGEDKTKRHSRGKFFVPKAGGNIAMNGGLTKSASFEMTTGLSNGYYIGSDNGSQGSLSHDQSSYENLMTRSCSNTTELDLDLQATPSSRRSRYCNWRGQRHHSQGENTNVRSHFRSHSQDNDNYLKAQKEISNKLANANCHTGQHMYQGSLESVQYVLHDRQLGSQTNPMKTSKEISDFVEVCEISNDNMGGLLALCDDVDIDTAVFNDHSVVELTADEESVNQTLKVDYDDSEAGNVTVKAEYTSELNDVHFLMMRMKVTTNGKQSNPRAAQGNSPAGCSSMTKPVVTKSSSSPPSSTATKNTNVVNTEGGSFPNTVSQTLSSEIKENKQRTESLNISSGDSGNRLSNGLTSDSWNKTFNSSDYIEENAQDKLVQMNSKEAPAVKRALKTHNKSPSSIPNIAKASVSCNNSQNQSKLPTLSQGNKALANVSPNQTNKIATSASRSVSGNSLSQTASEKKSAITKNSSSPANVGTVKGFARSLNNDTKASNVNRSNDSLKAPNQPLTPVSSGNSRRSSHSSTSGIPTKALDGSNSSLNTECNERTPPGVSNKKQVPSKIATLWKRDGSLERLPSRESPSSSASSMSKLPVSTSPSSTKPSSLPPSGFKAKTSFSLTVSESSSDGLCNSATYEKIASDVKVAKGRKPSQPSVKKAAVSKLTKQKQTSYESPESGVRRGEVFELYDDHEEEDDQNLYDTNDSLESNVFDDSMLNHQTTNDHSVSADSLDQSCDSSSHIDSSTFRKKKRDPIISNLELPNADETCKSMCSFNDSIGFNQSLGFKQKTSVTDSSFISGMSMSDTTTSKIDKKNKQKEKGKTKSKVLKRLFSSSRHKKNKSADKELSKGKKCSHKEKKNHKDKKDYDFFSANIKIEPSTMCDMDDKLICHQGTSTSITPKPGQSHTEHKVSPSAIVAPFNYNPPSTLPNGNASGLVAEILSSMPLSTNQQCSDDHLGENRDIDSLSSNPGKHLTKTEMLARRRQRNLSTGKENKSDAELLAACMVTTV